MLLQNGEKQTPKPSREMTKSWPRISNLQFLLSGRTGLRRPGKTIQRLSKPQKAAPCQRVQYCEDPTIAPQSWPHARRQPTRKDGALLCDRRPFAPGSGQIRWGEGLSARGQGDRRSAAEWKPAGAARTPRTHRPPARSSPHRLRRAAPRRCRRRCCLPYHWHRCAG